MTARRKDLPPAEAHLAKVCDGLARVVAKHPPFPGARNQDEAASRDPYQALFRAIIYQQLSGKAAATILARTIALFPRQAFPSPRSILKTDAETLRSAGVSRQKAAALKDLARRRLSGEVPAEGALESLDDEAIIARLTSASGRLTLLTPAAASTPLQPRKTELTLRSRSSRSARGKTSECCLGRSVPPMTTTLKRG
mgnify:CR=1 FL=1